MEASSGIQPHLLVFCTYIFYYSPSYKSEEVFAGGRGGRGVFCIFAVLPSSPILPFLFPSVLEAFSIRCSPVHYWLFSLAQVLGYLYLFLWTVQRTGVPVLLWKKPRAPVSSHHDCLASILIPHLSHRQVPPQQRSLGPHWRLLPALS